jgi:hypothetical protein
MSLSSPSSASVSRPVLITVLVVLVVLGGIASVIAGVIALVASGFLPAGLILIVVGLAYLAVARGLASGNNVARAVVAVVSALQVVFAVVALFQSDGDARGSSIGSGVVGLIVLLILFSPHANRFFGSRAA